MGVAHERFGEVPAAFIVLSQPGDEATAAALLDEYCIASMERWKRPRLYVFTDTIPRTAAKQTKMQGAMKAQINDLKVMNADGVTTLSALRAKASRG